MWSDGGGVADPGLATNREVRPEDLMAVVLAVPAAVPAARALMRTWLRGRAWPAEPAADVVLALNEALANVVDHAYPPDAPGTATLHAWIFTDPRTVHRRAVVAVTDRGRWAAHHPESPAPAARGHGLIMMSGCMAELHIQRADAGTTVIMISSAVPPAAAASPSATSVKMGTGGRSGRGPQTGPPVVAADPRAHSDVASRRRDGRADAAQPLTGSVHSGLQSAPSPPRGGGHEGPARGVVSCRR